MASSGVTYSTLRYNLHLPARGSGLLNKRVSFSPNIGISRNPLCLQRCKRITLSPKCAMDSTYGDNSPDVFPKINERDPYKRLGISKEASEDEIQAARNFLIQRYGGNKPSVDAIESAHDKIIMQKIYERKNPKINIKKKVREAKQSRYVQVVMNRFRTPSTNVIITTCIAFVVLGALTVFFPTEEGPTLQVAISMIGTVYFINDRLKNKLRAFLYGAGTFIVSWLLGTHDGFCNASITQRTNKLGSDNFIDKLHFPLGFFYLP